MKLLQVVCLVLTLSTLVCERAGEAAAEKHRGEELGSLEESACSSMENRCRCRRLRRMEQHLTCTKENCIERLPTSEIPYAQVKEVTSLLVSRQRNLTQIGSTELRRLGNIREIRIFRCAIREIEPDAFNGLIYVQRLDLHRNNLTEVPMAIRYLTKLKSLNLGGNRLQFIRPGAFYSNGYLERLLLGRNFLTVMPILLPSSLTKLSLSKNKFKSLGDLRALNKLKILYANGNKLTEFPRLPSSVNVVNLCSNLINETISVRNLPNLRAISLNHNPQVGDISLSTFSDAESRSFPSKLRSFKARNAGIRSIDENAFACIPNLQHIDVSHNLIQDYKPQWFARNKGLRSVFVAGNPWRCNCDVASSLRSIAGIFTMRRRRAQLRKGDSDADFSFTHDFFENLTCSIGATESCEKFKLRNSPCNGGRFKATWKPPTPPRPTSIISPISSTLPSAATTTTPRTTMPKTTNKLVATTTLAKATEKAASTAEMADTIINKDTPPPTTTTTSTTTTTTTSTTPPKTTKSTTTRPVTTTTTSRPISKTTTRRTTKPTATRSTTKSTTSRPTIEATTTPLTTTTESTTALPTSKTTTTRLTTKTTATTTTTSHRPTTTLPSTTATTTTSSAVTTKILVIPPTQASTAEDEWCLRDGRKCHFPFLYRGEEVFECTGFSNWCSPTYNYDEEGKWGVCKKC